jgi:hypothetical protein
VDVQAVPEFWRRLSPQEADRLDRLTASDTAPQKVFQQTVQTLMQMGLPLRRCRLIVAISKADLLAGLTMMNGRRSGNAWARAWLTEQLGLGNLVRSMRHEFGRVEYVFTAAVPDESGRLPGSIRAVTRRWIDARPLPVLRIPRIPRPRGRGGRVPAPDSAL